MGKNNPSDFPIMTKLEVILTDGERFAVASGAQFLGHLPSNEEVIKAIGTCAPYVKDMPPGFRLATPSEAYSYMANEMGLGRILVAAEPEWKHQEAIDKEFAAQLAVEPQEDADDE